MAGALSRTAVPSAMEYIQQQGLRLAPQELRASHRGGWITTECRIHGGSDSLRWNLKTGGWICMACEEHGGDALEYHRKAFGLSFVQAARDLGAWIEDDGRTVPPVATLAGQQVPSVDGARTRMESDSSAPRRSEPDQYQVLADFGRELLSACSPVHETAGADYLRARRCALPPRGSHLRFHPALKHPTGHVGPALVALVTDAASGAMKTLHRTWIRADGAKADVKPPRLLLGHHSKQGGVVRLWPDDYVTHGLAVAEGIETALSMAHAYSPVWACIDAGNLGALPVLGGVETLVIGADNDPAGAKGAEKCAERWWAAGAEVLITEQKQNDLNDVLTEAVQ